MLLQDKQSGSLVEIVDVEELFNPVHPNVKGRFQSGQNEQPSESIKKENLTFPSGENLPLCWIDEDYRMKSKPQ